MNTPLDTRQVRAFCVLARTGSYTQTARELHLTQSGVSHSMKALERDVGCRLFDKLGKKVVLTQAAEGQAPSHGTVTSEIARANALLKQAHQLAGGQ